MFSEKITEQTEYTLTCDGEYDAKFFLAVKQYGISYVPFTKSYRPLLTLKAELVDSTGNVIWRNQIAETPHSEIVDKRRREEWFSSPEIMKQEFSKIAESILERFAVHFTGGRVTR